MVEAHQISSSSRNGIVYVGACPIIMMSTPRVTRQLSGSTAINTEEPSVHASRPGAGGGGGGGVDLPTRFLSEDGCSLACGIGADGIVLGVQLGLGRCGSGRESLGGV